MAEYEVIAVEPIVDEIQYETVKTKHGKDAFIVGNCTYIFDGRIAKDTLISARCDKRRYGCRAKVRLNEATHMCIHMQGEHNHQTHAASATARRVFTPVMGKFLKNNLNPIPIYSISFSFLL